MSELSAIIGRLRARREALEITRTEAARRSGLSPNAPKAIEDGPSSPSLATLEKYAVGLGMRIECDDKPTRLVVRLIDGPASAPPEK